MKRTSHGAIRAFFFENDFNLFYFAKGKTLNNETPCQDSSLVPANENALWFLQIQPGYLESHRGAQVKPENVLYGGLLAHVNIFDHY